jgi:hypothetical protein
MMRPLNNPLDGRGQSDSGQALRPLGKGKWEDSTSTRDRRGDFSHADIDARKWDGASRVRRRRGADAPCTRR